MTPCLLWAALGALEAHWGAIFGPALALAAALPLDRPSMSMRRRGGTNGRRPTHTACAAQAQSARTRCVLRTLCSAVRWCTRKDAWCEAVRGAAKTRCGPRAWPMLRRRPCADAGAAPAELDHVVLCRWYPTCRALHGPFRASPFGLHRNPTPPHKHNRPRRRGPHSGWRNPSGPSQALSVPLRLTEVHSDNWGHALRPLGTRRSAHRVLPIGTRRTPNAWRTDSPNHQAFSGLSRCEPHRDDSPPWPFRLATTAPLVEGRGLLRDRTDVRLSSLLKNVPATSTWQVLVDESRDLVHDPPTHVQQKHLLGHRPQRWSLLPQRTGSLLAV